MRLYQLLDVMYKKDQVQVIGKPDQVLYDGNVEKAYQLCDHLKNSLINQEIVMIRPENNIIKIFIEVSD